MAKLRAPSEGASKICQTCGRPFTWRKAWRNCWPEVRHCSERCRRQRGKSRAAS